LQGVTLGGAEQGKSRLQLDYSIRSPWPPLK
jgi:hypothetical protein